MTSSKPAPVVPNHHADQPGFSGIGGYVAGLTMTIGRGCRRPACRRPGRRDRRRPCRRRRVRSRHRRPRGGPPGSPGHRDRPRPGDAEARSQADPPEHVDHLDRRRSRGAPAPRSLATVLWSISSVHHWRDVDAGLAEAHRVLLPHGRLLAIERHTRPGATGLASHGWTPAQADVFAERCLAMWDSSTSCVETHQLDRRALIAVRASKP